MPVTLFLSIQNVWRRVLLILKLLMLKVLLIIMTSTPNRFCNSSSFHCLFCFFMIGDDIRAGVDFGCRCIGYLFCSFGGCSGYQIRLLDMTIVLLFGELILSLLLLVLIPLIVLLILILK